MTEELPKQDFIKKCFGFLRLLHFSLTPQYQRWPPPFWGANAKTGGASLKKNFSAPPVLKSLFHPWLGPSSKKIPKEIGFR